MTRHGLVTLLLAMALLFVTDVVAQEKSVFDRWDKNGDGRLERDELPPNVRPNFNRVDTDNDGFISRKEDAAFRGRTDSNQPAVRARFPDSVTATLDVPYADTDNPRQRLDLLLPKNRKSKSPLPVIAYIHGGAWRSGSKSGGLRRVVPFVASGRYAGVSIGYRLSGEAKWPAQIHDCKAAIRWLRANAAEHGLDSDRIGVIGSSAGGHLVAMLGTSGDVKHLEGTLGNHQSAGSRVQCVVDEFGPTNFLTMNDFPSRIDHLAADSPESQLVGGAIENNKDAVRDASPLTYVTDDDPPFLIVHGTDDPLVPFNQSEILETALRAAGISVVLQKMQKGGHGRFRSETLNQRTARFFERHLREQDVAISFDPLPINDR